MALLRRNFLPQDLQPVLLRHGCGDCVAKQASESPAKIPFCWSRPRYMILLKNIVCKVSELVTAADWVYWQPADFKPCLEVVVEAFSYGRC